MSPQGPSSVWTQLTFRTLFLCIWPLMLPNESGDSVPLLATYKINYRLTNGRRKGAFNQNAGNLGRQWTQRPPKTTSEDSARP